MLDLHTHTVRCYHAVGTPEEYAEWAERRGLRILGQSCHSPWMIQESGRPLAMDDEELPDYVADVLRLRAQFDGRLEVLLGLEIDWYPDAEPEIRATNNLYPFDYLIGSVHHLPDDFSIQNPSVRNVFNFFDDAEIWPTYFEAIAAMVRSGLADIVAHIDLPKMKSWMDCEQWLVWADPAIEALAEAGGRVAVEINTSGRDKKIRRFFPDEPFLRRLHDAGVPLTLGSDAHAPHHVGRYFDEALALARHVGYNELTYFVRREPRTLHIPAPVA